ncbi:DUF2793 domain-containing protein [Rhodobacterales bacterium LSUCC0031]|nr:DUF2793 domain-containing protein [Rhodobacterales bacterium LSUCC0031]
MTDTPRMLLPLLAPAQAQKHVTVNEALVRIDALTHLVLGSISVSVPPVSAHDGMLYAVPEGAADEWAGQAGRLALRLGGGWVFVPPQRGWRAFVQDVGNSALWDGEVWRLGAMTLSPQGAALALQSLQFDLSITAGASVESGVLIPPRAVLFGVTGRVVATISGTAQSWSLGVAGDTGRFGTGLGVSLNSWVNGPAAPIVYWDGTPLLVSAQGGDFADGMVRLVIHYAQLSLPAPV